MRFLCLHGRGTNSKIFELQTAALRYTLGGNHEYEFVDGLIECDPYPGMESLLTTHDGEPEPTLSWFDSTTESLLSALSDLAEYIESEGPFDGVMGFSQGAALAATFIAWHRSLNSNQMHHALPFRLAVFICPGPIWNWKDENLEGLSYFTSEKDGEMIDIPAAVIWGAKDEYRIGGELISGLCSIDMKECFLHGGGHEIPRGKQEVDAMAATVKKAIDKTLYLQ